jgi:hypothetical protein
MKKSLIYVLLFSLCSAPVFAGNVFDNFTDKLTNESVPLAQSDLDNFASDLGAVMVAGSYHSGKSLGFPGIDVGIHAPMKNVSDKDGIVKATGLSYIGLPALQVEIGLPSNLDLLVRYSSIYNANLMGGGLRYGILRNSMPFLPNISVQGIYNSLTVASDANKFTATAMDISALASFNLPIVDPYVGVGYYSATVTPDSSIATPQVGMKGNGSGYRAEAGVNMGLIPLTYLQLGVAVMNGDLGGTLGIGARF